MSRLMSVALTEDAVRDRRKTVTRRLGWKLLKPGDTLTLCAKTRGVPKADRVELAEVEVVDVRREPLWRIIEQGMGECRREGFADLWPHQFVKFFIDSMGCEWDTEVTRIEWRYLEPAGDSL